MTAEEAVSFMRDTKRAVRYAGDTLWASLSGELVWGGCYIEDCEGCDSKSEVGEWVEYHTREGTEFEGETSAPAGEGGGKQGDDGR